MVNRLTHLLNQKNLSGRQVRWLEKISSFTFRVVYIEESENVVAGALSHAWSEFTTHNVVDDDMIPVLSNLPSDVPVLAGMEARVATRRGTWV